MEKQVNKTIAPVIVSICLIGYYIAGGIFLIKFNVSNIIKVIAVMVSLLISIVIIMVLIERIKEIKGGEEDDLGKY